MFKYIQRWLLEFRWHYINGELGEARAAGHETSYLEQRLAHIEGKLAALS